MEADFSYENNVVYLMVIYKRLSLRICLYFDQRRLETLDSLSSNLLYTLCWVLFA